MDAMANGIRIAVSDGSNSINVGVINCGGHYVATQVSSEGNDTRHDTYHKNGYMHVKEFPNTENANEVPRYYGPPLNDFKGFCTASVKSLPKEVGWLVSPEFDAENPVDNTVYINADGAKHGIAYQEFICEPGFPVNKVVQEKISNAVEEGEDYNLSVHTYTKTEPWVGVIHWNQGSGVQFFTHTKHFRPMEPSLSGLLSGESCQNDVKGCGGPDGEGYLCESCYNVLNGT